MALVVFGIWFLLIQGPAPSLAPRSSGVDLFSYYRQFDDVDELELNRERRERRAAERALALEQVPGPRPLRAPSGPTCRTRRS